jgi:hypothetical protein
LDSTIQNVDLVSSRDFLLIKHSWEMSYILSIYLNGSKWCKSSLLKRLFWYYWVSRLGDCPEVTVGE